MKLPIYHFLMPNQYLLTSTFLRFQETYESPKFKGKGFSLEEFQDWYASTNKSGMFTYYTDWVGFNFPSSIIESFTPERFGVLSKKEHWVCDQLAHVEGEFYVIGSLAKKKRSAKAHELIHALFYINKEYATRVREVFSAHDFSAFFGVLSDLGYCDDVFVDEANAYITTGLCADLIGIDEEKVKEVSSKLFSLIKDFFGFDASSAKETESFFSENVHEIIWTDVQPSD